MTYYLDDSLRYMTDQVTRLEALRKKIDSEDKAWAWGVKLQYFGGLALMVGCFANAFKIMATGESFIFGTFTDDASIQYLGMASVLFAFVSCGLWFAASEFVKSRFELRELAHHQFDVMYWLLEEEGKRLRHQHNASEDNEMYDWRKYYIQRSAWYDDQLKAGKKIV